MPQFLQYGWRSAYCRSLASCCPYPRARRIWKCLVLISKTLRLSYGLESEQTSELLNSSIAAAAADSSTPKNTADHSCRADPASGDCMRSRRSTACRPRRNATCTVWMAAGSNSDSEPEELIAAAARAPVQSPTR